ncbi:MAG: hypothetical protein ACREQN_14430 [Candidatus Binataceae bacterium]
MAPNDDDTIDATPDTLVAAASDVKSKPADEFDPMTWEVPLICKDCGRGFTVPYRHFQAGVVFHCPHCHGSFVPNTSIYRAVTGAFETFHTARQRARAAFQQGRHDSNAFARREERANEDFRRFMDRIAREMKPAGKLLRRKGFGAMFT